MRWSCWAARARSASPPMELGAAFGSVHTEVQMAGFYNTPIFVE
jgi:hypothetical protein